MKKAASLIVYSHPANGHNQKHKEYKNIMVWTSGGHRIIEEKNLNANNYNFRITVNEKIFFIWCS